MAQASKRKRKRPATGDENSTDAMSVRPDKVPESNKPGSLPLRISCHAMTNCTNRPAGDDNENLQPSAGTTARTSNAFNASATPARLVRQEDHRTTRDSAVRTHPTATTRHMNGVNEDVNKENVTQSPTTRSASHQVQSSNGLRRTDNSSPPARSTPRTRNPQRSDDELAELQRRLAEHEQRKRELAEHKRQLQLHERKLAKQGHNNAAAACRERIEVLRKPKGEAGDSKRGFQLQDAMGLGDSEDGDMGYNEFLLTNRQNAHKAGIDLNLTYRQQDPANLAKLFKLNCMAIPYLTRERFPNDWPQVKALKQYIRNARRGIARKQCRGEKNRKQRTADDAEGENHEYETPAHGNRSKHQHFADKVDENGAGPSRLRPIEEDDDDENEDEEDIGGDDWGHNDPFAEE